MVDKRPIGVIAGKSDYLDKKVPKNPKYANVGTTLNTGLHAKHVEVISDQTIAKRKDELFRRIKPSTLAIKLQQDTNAESIFNLVNTGDNEDYDLSPGDNQSVYSASTAKTGYSDASKLSSVTSAQAQLVIGESSEFLLLDLREPEDYEQFHIKEAINYPAPNLGRDKVIPELYAFKNKENKLIILYHLDERNGVQYANLMSQKGYDNVYLITGGVEAFLEQYHELVEGKKVPAPTKQVDKKGKVLYKRAKHMGDPEDGDVKIPAQHLYDEDDKKSTTSNVTRASQLTGMSRTNQGPKTQTNMSKATTGRMPETKK